MREEKISMEIMDVCKKLGVPYTSCNEKAARKYSSCEKLGQCYRDLQIMKGDIYPIFEEHQMDEFKEAFERILYLIDTAEHDISKMAKKLMSEDKKDDGK